MEYFETLADFPFTTRDIGAALWDVKSILGAAYSHSQAGYELGIKIYRPLLGVGATWIVMNPLLASYAVFFYLGSLVRYQPEYLDALLHSKEAWLIERFIRGAGASAVVRMASAMAKKNIVVKTI